MKALESIMYAKITFSEHNIKMYYEERLVSDF